MEAQAEKQRKEGWVFLNARGCLQVREEVNGKQETENGKKEEIIEGPGAWRPWQGGASSTQEVGGPLLRRGPASSFAVGREGGNIPRDLEVLG